MLRICAVLFACLVLILIVGGRRAAAEVQTALEPGGSIAAEIAGLKDQLEKGLKARRPVEFEFIEKVVEMVETEKLPLDLVRSTFQWARYKKPYPYPYFERGLKIRAEKLGIEM